MEAQPAWLRGSVWQGHAEVVDECTMNSAEHCWLLWFWTGHTTRENEEKQDFFVSKLKERKVFVFGISYLGIFKFVAIFKQHCTFKSSLALLLEN